MNNEFLKTDKSLVAYIDLLGGKEMIQKNPNKM